MTQIVVGGRECKWGGVWEGAEGCPRLILALDQLAAFNQCLNDVGECLFRFKYPAPISSSTLAKFGY